MECGKMIAGGLCVCACALSFPVFGETYYANPARSDWSKAESFWTGSVNGDVATSVPGSEDTIVVGEGTWSFTAGTGSFDVLANVKAVRTTSYQKSVLGITVPEGVTATLLCAVYPNAEGYDASLFRWNSGITKTGKGSLVLGCPHGDLWRGKSIETWNYMTTIRVLEGSLHILPGCRFTWCYVGMVQVAEGAKLYLPYNASGSTTTCQSRGISGAGDIVNGSSVTCVFNPEVIRLEECFEDSVFTGRLLAEGTGAIKGTFSGPIYLSGESSFADDVTIRWNGGEFTTGEYGTFGVTSVDSIGMLGQSSPIGAGGVSFAVHGGVLHYAGEGETTDKTFTFWRPDQKNKVPAGINAGPNGGIVFESEGGSSCWTATGSQGHDARVLLLGDNSFPCRVRCPVKPQNGNSLYFMKRGSGAWIFEGAATNSSNGGSFAIESGTLGFETIAEKGVYSALGTATALHTFLDGKQTLDALGASVSEFAVTLCATSSATRGTFSYTGSGFNHCTTRPIALAAHGGRISNDGTGRLWLGGVTVRDADSSTTLVLGGANDSENVLENVTNGVGSISLVKEDAGTWRLSKNVDVDSVKVKGGTLIVENHPLYRYFRLVCQQCLNSGTTTQYPQLQEVALFSEDGVRRNTGMVYKGLSGWNPDTSIGYSMVRENAYGYSMLEPGEAAYGGGESVAVSYYCGSAGNQYRDLANLFDDAFDLDVGADPDTSPGWLLTRHGLSGDKPVLDNRDTWIPIVMRVADGTPKITSFDIVSPSGSAADTELVAWELEASANGRDWEHVKTYRDTSGVTHHQTPTARAKWYSDWTEYTPQVNENRAGKGFRFSGHHTNDTLTVSIGGSVEIYGGATLRVDGEPLTVGSVTLDATAGGTLENVAYAPSGTLTLVNVQDVKKMTVPGSVGAFDLTGWTVELPDASGARSVYVSNGRLVVRKGGLTVTVR